MPWWLVWVLLVIAAIALLAWVGLRLWRSFRALLAELETLSDLLDQLETRMAELDALASDEGPREPTLLLTPDERAHLRAVRADIKAKRAARREGRYRAALAAWDQITG